MDFSMFKANTNNSGKIQPCYHSTWWELICSLAIIALILEVQMRPFNPRDPSINKTLYLLFDQ